MTEVCFSTTCSSRSFGMTISVSTFSLQLRDPGLRLLGALAALEGERARDDADGEGAQLAGDLGDDRRAAGAGAAALAGRDEDHVRALQRLLDLVPALERGRLGRPPGSRRRRGRASRCAPMWSFRSASHMSSACASVFTATNSTPLEAGVDHPVDRVRAAAADADDLDHR